LRPPAVDNPRPRGYKRHMHFDWTLFFMALGLALLFEGLPYFIMAERMPRLLLILASRPPRALRALGLTAMILGVLLMLLGRSLS